MTQVSAQLRQVGAIERAGMQINQGVAMTNNVLKERIGDARCGTALGVAGEVAIQVAAVGQVA